MKIFLDENIEAGVASALTCVYVGHTFVSAFSDVQRYCNVDDPALFARLAADDFHVIITQDRRQLADDTERRALHDAGLHWIGQRHVDVDGVAGTAFRLATICSGLAVVLENLTDQPTAFRLKGVERLSAQRLAGHEPLWREAWGTP